MQIHSNAPISDSAIGQHLLDNKICAGKFDVNWFSILARGRSSLDLATLKETFIESLDPLFVASDFVSELKLLWTEFVSKKEFFSGRSFLAWVQSKNKKEFASGLKLSRLDQN